MSGRQWNLALYQSKKECESSTKKQDHILRNLSVLAQRNDLQKWKDSVGYGKRWIVETVFSSIKRSLENMSTRLDSKI